MLTIPYSQEISLLSSPKSVFLYVRTYFRSEHDFHGMVKITIRNNSPPLQNVSISLVCNDLKIKNFYKQNILLNWLLKFERNAKRQKNIFQKVILEINTHFNTSEHSALSPHGDCFLQKKILIFSKKNPKKPQLRCSYEQNRSLGRSLFVMFKYSWIEFSELKSISMISRFYDSQF